MLPSSNSVSRRRPCLKCGQSLQIEQPAHHHCFLSDIVRCSPREPAESVIVFGFTPQLFYFLPGPLADDKSKSSFSHSNPFVGGIPSSIHRRDIGLNAPSKQSLDEF